MNQIISDYLKANSTKYKDADLKKKILAGGYSGADYNEALASIKHKSKEKDAIEKNYASGDTRGKGFKWIFVGFIASVILTLFVFYSQMLEFLPSFSLEENTIVLIIAVALLLILVVSKILALFGFYKTGKYAGKSSLKISSLILIISFVLLVVLSISSVVYFSISDSTSSVLGFASFDDGENNSFGNEIAQMVSMTEWGAISLFMKIFSIIGIVLMFIYSISYIFFSVGLIKVRGSVKFGLTSGIFRLIVGLIGLCVTVFLTFVFVSFAIDPTSTFEILNNESIINIFSRVFGLIFLAAYVFETMALFVASKKFERK